MAPFSFALSTALRLLRHPAHFATNRSACERRIGNGSSARLRPPPRRVDVDGGRHQRRDRHRHLPHASNDREPYRVRHGTAHRLDDRRRARGFSLVGNSPARLADQCLVQGPNTHLAGPRARFQSRAGGSQFNITCSTDATGRTGARRATLADRRRVSLPLHPPDFPQSVSPASTRAPMSSRTRRRRRVHPAPARPLASSCHGSAPATRTTSDWHLATSTWLKVKIPVGLTLTGILVSTFGAKSLLLGLAKCQALNAKCCII